MILDGKKLSLEIQSEIKREIDTLHGKKPGLAVILVGDNPASHVYVKAKAKACASVGIHSSVIELPASIAESDLLRKIEELNETPSIHGILVQLPLPKHIDESLVIAMVDPKKDIDGFHPMNVGKMLIGDDDGFLPCTPFGIQVMLERYKVPVEGKHVVIVGRSNIVGKPMAAILMQKKKGCNATVTVVHSGSENLKEITRSADILIAAIGRPRFIDPSYVRPKVTVVDVGINRLENKKLAGDVDFEKLKDVAEHITPVPGGVGPMTIAMLLKNTLKSFMHLALFLLCLISCQKQDPCTHFEGEAFGTPYSLSVGKKLSAKSEADILRAVEKVFQEMHVHFDLENTSSEISALNALSEETLAPLSLPMQKLLALSQNIVQISGGRFDPAIEPLSKIWKRAKKENTLPSPPEQGIACDASGWSHISIQNGIFKKDHPSSQLRLDGVAKGFCIDQIIESLISQGIENAFVEWGGKARAIGHHPDSKDWAVQINPHLTSNHEHLAPIPLRNSSIATSGRHIEEMIDPLTASPLQKMKNSVAFASVIAPTCSLADALATAALLFSTRKEAESWAQEVVELYPEVKFWILSYN